MLIVSVGRLFHLLIKEIWRNSLTDKISHFHSNYTCSEEMRLDNNQHMRTSIPDKIAQKKTPGKMFIDFHAELLYIHYKFTKRTPTGL